MNKEQFIEHIRKCNYKELFNELGWNNDRTKHTLDVEGKHYLLNSVAEKRGFKIFFCESDSNLNSDLRKRVDINTRKLFHYYILILKNPDNSQHWIVPVNKTEKRELVYIHISPNQTPELLYQKLSELKFTIDLEEKLTIVDVSNLVNKLFVVNSEKVTKQFYERFKKEHSSFMSFISGIDDNIKNKENKQKQWYASVMLNRLMFCYFIQKKEFLDGNKNYLKDKLVECRNKIGEESFYGFYRSFLLKLFHKGLGNPDNEVYKPLIGKIPYLNGGLFDVHEIEMLYKNIDIEDEAFEKIFNFFDEYEWHLDTGISGSGKEINPDVIGYIFEKYINDRADMGAYYTKEDITDYISKNTIIPFLFEESKRKYPSGFNEKGSIWKYLKKSGDKYIYDSVKHGINPEDVWGDLPDDVKNGMDPNQENLYEIRKCWNIPAPESIALPTEIWREVIERRKRYIEIFAKIKNGEINKINDFITYNLNIKQFAQDFLDETDDPEIVRNFHNAISEITILDPTCGSGAFLFAAMNILEPLYESCILRMEEFISGSKKGKYLKFEEVLSETRNPKHPNLEYYIYKNIILNNLYGVDIMNEAVEIAKLRLFLKLVSCTDADRRKRNMGLEPLPDIDFNIKSGNTLVGFATINEAIKIINEKEKPGQIGLVFDDELDVVNSIKNRADDLANVYSSFKKAQLNDKLSDVKKAKEKLLKHQKELNNILNEYMSFMYGIDSKKYKQKYYNWLKTHKPFHWFAEFYEILNKNKGFDCIIGNPPYVEYSLNKSQYILINYKTINCGNLYAFIIERCTSLFNTKSLFSMIVPMSGTLTSRMLPLQELLLDIGFLCCLYFAGDSNPGQLFEGVKSQLSIIIATKSKAKSLFTTKYKRWFYLERNHLFKNISLINSLSYKQEENFLKIGSKIEISIFNKFLNLKSLSEYNCLSNNVLYYKNAGNAYYRMCYTKKPINKENNIDKDSSTLASIAFKFSNKIAQAIISSNIFNYFWFINSDCYHLTKKDIMVFKIFNINDLDKNDQNNIINLSKELENDYYKNSSFKITRYKGKGVIEYQEFYPRLSKNKIDLIDILLNKYYKFEYDELDFIINYDIKYRLG